MSKSGETLWDQNEAKSQKRIESQAIIFEENLLEIIHMIYLTTKLGKVRVFWEGHKIWKNLPLKIWRYSVMSNFKWKIFSNFVAFSEYPNFKEPSFFLTDKNFIFH